MKYLTAFISDAGPRAINEDAVGVWNVDETLAVAVADGLGGMGGGNRASQIAIEDFDNYLHNGNPRPDGLHELTLKIHSQIREAQKLATEFSNMATTFNAGMFKHGKMFAVHCGDSRIAIARGAGIMRLTRDHSEAQRLLTAGKLNKEELLDYPRKNILESALGINGSPKIDDIEFDLQIGDKIFFTTDGVHNIVQLRELKQFAEESADPQDIVSRVDATIRQRGPEDNYTMVAIYVCV